MAKPLGLPPGSWVRSLSTAPGPVLCGGWVLAATQGAHSRVPVRGEVTGSSRTGAPCFWLPRRAYLHLADSIWADFLRPRTLSNFT